MGGKGVEERLEWIGKSGSELEPRWICPVFS